MKNPKITTLQPKLSKHRKDSFWYGDYQQIALVEHKDKTFSVETRGS
jgi:hypothetical protein